MPAGSLKQKQNFRDALEMVRGGFFSREKPLDGSGSPYTNSAFALGQLLAGRKVQIEIVLMVFSLTGPLGFFAAKGCFSE